MEYYISEIDKIASYLAHVQILGKLECENKIK